MQAMTGRAGDPAGDAPAVAQAGRPAAPALRLAGLLLGITVPMNAATAIFIWYLSPLMLAALGRVRPSHLLDPELFDFRALSGDVSAELDAALER